MTNPADRFIPRILVLQTLTAVVTTLVLIAFAPRLLLLEPNVVDETTPLILLAAGGTIFVAAIITLLATRSAQPLLRALAAGSTVIDPGHVLALYAVPARLVTLDVVGCTVVGALTLLPALRPSTNDLYTQGEIVVLGLTMVSVGALPFYVMARATVARVLEVVPVAACRDAFDLLDAQRANVRRGRRRLFAAVVAPVAFVALGAALLVHAHLRAFDTTSRASDAIEVVRGALDPISGSVAGRKEAIEAASERGFAIDLSRAGASLETTRGEEGQTSINVPLEDGSAVVRFATSRLSPTIGLYLLIAIAATAIAGLLGARIGAAFGHDVALATREVRATGALDVIRGTRLPRDARFASVAALTAAIDELGNVFREFAAAQERAIEARAATERMRGLFLASMSHDLKAPLNAIQGFAELLTRGPLTEGQRESVTIVEQRGRELLHLIETILDAARAEAGELTIAAEWTRVGDVVMAGVLDARDLVLGLDVQIVGEIQPGMPRVYADSVRATQAITAVILAAVRFAESGMVRVRATLPAAGEELRIDVETTGRGLGSTERDRIFEAFRHADRARKHGSLGLGPSLARSIIELHGGRVDVETTQEGGTVFHIWLPTEKMKAIT